MYGEEIQDFANGMWALVLISTAGVGYEPSLYRVTKMGGKSPKSLVRGWTLRFEDSHITGLEAYIGDLVVVATAQARSRLSWERRSVEYDRSPWMPCPRDLIT